MTERREEKARLKRTASMLPNNGAVWVVKLGQIKSTRGEKGKSKHLPPKAVPSR